MAFPGVTPALSSPTFSASTLPDIVAEETAQLVRDAFDGLDKLVHDRVLYLLSDGNPGISKRASPSVRRTERGFDEVNLLDRGTQCMTDRHAARKPAPSLSVDCLHYGMSEGTPLERARKGPATVQHLEDEMNASLLHDELLPRRPRTVPKEVKVRVLPEVDPAPVNGVSAPVITQPSEVPAWRRRLQVPSSSASCGPRGRQARSRRRELALDLVGVSSAVQLESTPETEVQFVESPFTEHNAFLELPSREVGAGVVQGPHVPIAAVKTNSSSSSREDMPTRVHAPAKDDQPTIAYRMEGETSAQHPQCLRDVPTSGPCRSAAVKLQRWWRGRVEERPSPTVSPVDAERAPQMQRMFWSSGKSAPGVSHGVDAERARELHNTFLAATSVTSGRLSSKVSSRSVDDSGMLSRNDSPSEPSPIEDQFGWMTSDDEISSAIPFLLQAWGIVPWEVAGKYRRFDMIYQLLAMLVVVAACVGLLVHAADAVNSGLSTDGSIRLSQLSDAALAVGTLASCFSMQPMRRKNYELLGARDAILDIYARTRGFVRPWRSRSRRGAFLVAVLWLALVGSRVACGAIGSYSESGGALASLRTVSIPHTLAFAVTTGFFAALVLSMLHVLHALLLMIDRFCCLFVEDPNVPERIREWNMLQAILRRASRAMTPVVLTTHSAAIAALILTAYAAASGDAASLRDDQERGTIKLLALQFPVVCFLAVLIGGVFFRLTEVTVRCDRVPAFINSFDRSGEDIDKSLQYLVSYVTYSAAGFYVSETRLTRGSAMKATYVFGIAFLTLASRIASVN